MTDHLHSFTLADLVREQARTLPDATALVDPSRSLTYAQVDQETDRWARWLSGRGIGTGRRVAWIGPDDHQLLLLMFAVAKLGGHTVPLNWRCTDEELTGMIVDADPALLVTAPNPRASAPHLTDTGCAVVELEQLRTSTAMAGVAGGPQIFEDDEAPVLGFYTAAWSGNPKLALIPHRAIITQSLVLGAYREVDVGAEVYLASGPMFHVGALLKLFANYLFGNKVVLAPGGGPEEICDLIETESVTSGYLFTPTIDRIAQTNAARRWNLTTLRTTPAAPSVEHAKQWYAMTNCDPSQDSRLVGYGQTETWAMAVYTARGPDTVSAFGRPSPVSCVRILDDQGREVAPGRSGEIVVRGPQLMSGYARTATATAMWHRTGDLGVRVEDGGVDFLGPRQAMIKTGMENVYPAEVEAALNRHSGIAASCVVGVPDPAWGERVCAAVVPHQGQQLDEQEVISFVKSQIASYKKPRQILLLDKLPTRGGGVDRDAVQRLFEGLDPESESEPHHAAR